MTRTPVPMPMIHRFAAVTKFVLIGDEHVLLLARCYLMMHLEVNT